MCSLNSQISPASKNRAPIHHESAKFLRPGQSLISPPRHGYCNVFFWGEMFLFVFGSGQSDVRSGTSMTKCYLVNANTFYTLIHPNTAHAQSVDYLRVRRSTFCRMQYCSIGSPEFMFTCLSDEEQGERLYSQATRQTTI